MKITHNNKTYIDAATHAGLRCWVTQELVDKNEAMPGWLGPMGDYAEDELIRYAVDPDGYRHGNILITDIEDHRKHWPLRNTHRHPLEAAATEIEGDQFEPAGTLPVVGDVLHRGGTDFKVNEIDLVDRYYYESRSSGGFHRQIGRASCRERG